MFSAQSRQNGVIRAGSGRADETVKQIEPGGVADGVPWTDLW